MSAAAPGGRRVTRSAAETERLGAGLAPALAPGDVLCLSGPLGSGKTRFDAGLAQGLGVHSRVRSPSFTLIHEYRAPVPLVHLDLYRLETVEAAALGLEEELERAVLAVEWGERLPAELRADALLLAFAVLGPEERAITASAAGPRGAALAERWCGIAEVDG